MEQQKKILNELISISKYEIRKPDDDFFSLYVSYEGTPRKLIDDKSKIILLSDPFSNMGRIYEFPVKAVGYIEEIGTISSENSESVLKIRLWVKKGTVGIESNPFLV